MMKLGVVECIYIYGWILIIFYLMHLYLRAYRNGDKMSKTVEKIKRVFEEESFTDD